MKKKIVYISGADTFDVNDVRSAFDEVRSTLNLDADTILFGVPVDDEASESVSNEHVDEVCDAIATDSVKDDTDELVEVQQEIAQDIVVDSEPDKVVPILSVLGGKKKQTDASEAIEPVVTPVANQTPKVADIIDDDMPEEPTEKTLEELLETMAPLREDVRIEPIQDSSDSVIETEETDATLESLANEYAKVQDNVPATKKSGERGKISKLKNILPFKKIKHNDDSGIMGDLFGWAGIAANDEEFTMPGFFTAKR